MSDAPSRRVLVVDLVAKAPTRRLWGRVMNANLAGVMPQAVAHWCEDDGHEVRYACYTGTSIESFLAELPDDPEIVFVSAFTQAAQFSYALSNLMRSRRAVTVLGGPHARCYPHDARKYFDYVLGFTDRQILRDVLAECAPNRPHGRLLAARGQPAELPGVRQRWKYIEAAHRKARALKIVPMIASLGCPYTCDFCIDAEVPYAPLPTETIRDDLRFLLTRFKRPRVGWHDPNFGIRFDDTLEAIEAAVPPDSVDFISESSLSLLTEKRVQRLRRAGFKAVLPGIESWFGLGDKSKTGLATGLDKVHRVADHVNMVLRHIPYVQTNFLFGLDCDEGSEPFELTKRFIDATPGAFPAYSILTSFGSAAPANRVYQESGRLIPFPFHFMNNSHVINVKPRNYTTRQLLELLVDLARYSFSPPVVARRFIRGAGTITRAMNLMRAFSSEGKGRIQYHTRVLEQLASDAEIRAFWEGDTRQIPQFYVDWIRRDLGPLWEWLPEGALYHSTDTYAAA